MRVLSQVNNRPDDNRPDERRREDDVPTHVHAWRRVLLPSISLTTENRRLLWTLALFSVLVGYQGTVLTGLLTYAADTWDVTLAARGRTLAALRGDVMVAMIIVWIADRKGRRMALLGATLVSALFTALSALSNGIWMFGALQFVARGANTAAAILIAVLIAEGLPQGSRAWGSSLVVATAAVGSAFVFVISSQADNGPNWWRLITYR